MIDVLPVLFPQADQALLIGFLVFLRVGAVMALMPAFGEQSVPVRVRLGLALAFSMIVAPAAGEYLKPPETGPVAVYMLITEVILGLALGIILRLVVLVLVMSGQVAAQATSLSQIFGGAGVEPQPAMSALLVIAGLALAVQLGLHVRAAEAIIASYRAFPPGTLPGGWALTGWGVAHLAKGFALAVTLAMPFVVASLIYNLALGAINRAMPQLMVALVGAPAITAGGLALLLIAAPSMLETWARWMTNLLADPFVMPT